MDRASPKLFEACAAGTVFESAHLVHRHPRPLARKPDLRRLRWPSTPGVVHTVEWSPDLKKRFEPLRRVTADGASTPVDLPLEGTMGFLRIALP